jgi:hypothetical protein
VKRDTWGRVHLTGVWVSVEEGEERYLGSCAFVNTKVSVNIACKHEGAVHRGQARCPSRAARVALIGRSRCSTRIRQVSELNKGHCSQSRHYLQMVVGQRTQRDKRV